MLRCWDSVYLQTNDRANPKPSQHGSAKFRSALLLDCEKYGNGWFVDFRELSRDAGPQTKSVELRRGDGGPLNPKVLGIEPWPRDAQHTQAPSAEAKLRVIESGERYALDITIRPPYDAGRIRLATGVPEQPEDEVQFIARFQRP